MSIQASIEIRFEKEIDVLKILNLLSQVHWHFNDYGKITLMDNDDFDWRTLQIDDLIKVHHIIEARFIENKLVGVAIVKNDIGCLFHFLPFKKELMILTSINRVKIPAYHTTDYSFYLKEFNEILSNCPAIVCTDAY